MVLSENDILRNFDQRDLVRGRSYFLDKRVVYLSLEDGGKLLRARVKGTDTIPYEVNLNFYKRANGTLEIDSDCSCPVGYKCKHAVAALYEYLSEHSRQRENIHKSSPATKSGKGPVRLSGMLTSWLADFDDAETEKAPQESVAQSERKLVYLVSTQGLDRNLEINIEVATIWRTRSGEWTKPKPEALLRIVNGYDNLLQESDQWIVRMQHILGLASHTGFSVKEPELQDILLKRAIATGRAYFTQDMNRPLSLGDELQGTLSWELTQNGKQKPTIQPPRKNLRVLMMTSPWYIDMETQHMGPLRSPLSPDKTMRYFEAPPVDASEIKAIRARLAATNAKIPAPYEVVTEKAGAVQPIARLRLRAAAVNAAAASDEIEGALGMVFDYEGTEIHPAETSTQYGIVKDDKIHLLPRDKRAEKALLTIIADIGLDTGTGGTTERGDMALHLPETASLWPWLDFVHITAPRLRDAGIDVVIESSFTKEVLAPDGDAIEASFTQSGAWWFDLELGVQVDGKRVELLPILVALLQRVKSVDDIRNLSPESRCYAPLPDGRHIALPVDRVKTILAALIELAGEKPLDEAGRLKVSLDLATAFSKLESITNSRWMGEARLLQMIEKLGTFEGIESKNLPDSLKAELRPYQKQGYDWLNFLHDYNLGGILADDMGLGKTVQTLAYILSLKEKGKLKKPVLVVMPTSLVSNWQAETERFAPSLRVLVLHGKDRGDKFSDISKADIVFSTYPLLARDAKDLEAKKWQIVILDEAQAIKNPSAKMTQAACALQAEQRICLTGTPIENHLGEAWSLFTFLMPGLLGNHREFTRNYRKPIEEKGDNERQVLLAMRLKPFILRRLKTDVAKELPPKTEIIQRVTLADDQRDLYETVRHLMNDKIRDELAAKGFARSQIVILDALLKLRQVCCDPRLVSIPAASKVKSSAKLEELMEMLPTLIEDGRKILLFSQFTSMLDLIKPELAKAGIPYVELRGTTKDRKTPIEQFQKGDVPLFLISLKAGGTGLNLTAADTVIHFDPWWNPSVENQATDRAHRIGQDKPVFVYKMIAEGTVEERILELQSRKAQLASALYGQDPAKAAALSQDDLKWLLEPVA